MGLEMKLRVTLHASNGSLLLMVIRRQPLAHIITVIPVLSHQLYLYPLVI